METGHKFDLSQFTEFKPGGIARRDILKGQHFNARVICLDSGAEIPPRDESYEVLFYVVSGKGVISAGAKHWDVGPGSMVFAPVGSRGIKCLEPLTILGIQEPH